MDLAETINFESRVCVFLISSEASNAEVCLLQLEASRKQGMSPTLKVDSSMAAIIHGEGGGETESTKLPKTIETCDAEEHEVADAKASRSSSSSPSESSSSDRYLHSALIPCYESKDSMVQGQMQWKDRLCDSL